MSALSAGPASGAWTESMESIMRRLYAGIALLTLGFLWFGPGPQAVQAHVSTFIAQSVLVVLAAWSVLRRGFVRAGACLACAVVLALVVIDPAGPGLGIVIPLFLAYLGVTLRPLPSVAVTAALTLIHVECLRRVDPTRSLRLDLVGQLALCCIVYATSQVVRILREVARANDMQATTTAARRRREARAVATEVEARWVDHFLHDCLAHALKAITLGARLSAREVRTTAYRAHHEVQRLADEVAVPDLGARIRRAVEECGLDVTVSLDRAEVPPLVAEALAGAVGEALRNVAQHAGVDRAEVRLDRLARGVRIRVRDRGRGFDVRHTPAGHYGVSRSIVGRLEEVGGSAKVSSSARGTLVEVRWLAPRIGPEGWLDRVHGRRAATVIAAPFVALNIVQAALMFPSLSYPWAAAAATGVVTALWVAATAQYAQRVPGRFGPEVLAVIAIGLSAVGAFCFPLRHADPAMYWLAGGVLPLTMFVILYRRARVAVPFAVVTVLTPVACLVWRGAGPTTMAAMVPATVAPMLGTANLFVAIAFVRRLTSRMVERERRDVRSFERELAATMRERLVAERVTGLREWIAPFLADVADGRVDPGEVQVRRLAAVYEARVRDGLGGEASSWDAEVRPVVDDLRVRGATATMHRHVAMVPTQAQMVLAVLRSLETLVTNGWRVTVSTTPRPSGSVASVTVTPFEPSLLDRWNVFSDKAISVRTDHATYVRISCAHLVEATSRPASSGHAPAAQVATMAT